MATNAEKPKVLIARCEKYEPERIADITGQGMDELGALPRGRMKFRNSTSTDDGRAMLQKVLCK